MDNFQALVTMANLEMLKQHRELGERRGSEMGSLRHCICPSFLQSQVQDQCGSESGSIGQLGPWGGVMSLTHLQIWEPQPCSGSLGHSVANFQGTLTPAS